MTLSEAVERWLQRQLAISPRSVTGRIGEPLSPRSAGGTECRMSWLASHPDPLRALSPLHLRCVLLKYSAGLGQLVEDEDEEDGIGYGRVKVGRRRRREAPDYAVAQVLWRSCEEVRRLLREAERVIVEG